MRHRNDETVHGVNPFKTFVRDEAMESAARIANYDLATEKREIIREIRDWITDATEVDVDTASALVNAPPYHYNPKATHLHVELDDEGERIDVVLTIRPSREPNAWTCFEIRSNLE